MNQVRTLGKNLSWPLAHFAHFGRFGPFGPFWTFHKNGQRPELIWMLHIFVTLLSSQSRWRESNQWKLEWNQWNRETQWKGERLRRVKTTKEWETWKWKRSVDLWKLWTDWKETKRIRKVPEEGNANGTRTFRLNLLRTRSRLRTRSNQPWLWSLRYGWAVDCRYAVATTYIHRDAVRQYKLLP